MKGTLELEKIVDPEILGGFILELDFVRWNASLSNQLNRIKNQYIERNRRIV
jgi:F-type H+-transporting ATPase subunit delta